MEYPVTLMVREPIYRQAEAMAAASQKSIAEVLVEQLVTAPPPPHIPGDPEHATIDAK
jgi:hypothetical protein